MADYVKEWSRRLVAESKQYALRPRHIPTSSPKKTQVCLRMRRACTGFTKSQHFVYASRLAYTRCRIHHISTAVWTGYAVKSRPCQTCDRLIVALDGAGVKLDDAVYREVPASELPDGSLYLQEARGFQGARLEVKPGECPHKPPGLEQHQHIIIASDLWSAQGFLGDFGRAVGLWYGYSSRECAAVAKAQGWMHKLRSALWAAAASDIKDSSLELQSLLFRAYWPERWDANVATESEMWRGVGDT